MGQGGRLPVQGRGNANTSKGGRRSPVRSENFSGKKARLSLDARSHTYQLTANGNRANCKLNVDPTAASGRRIKNNNKNKQNSCLVFLLQTVETVGHKKTTRTIVSLDGGQVEDNK